jgi:hypothetical protein
MVYLSGASVMIKNKFFNIDYRHRDIGYQSTIHDLKLLLLRFAQVCIRLLFVSRSWFKMEWNDTNAFIMTKIRSLL